MVRHSAAVLIVFLLLLIISPPLNSVSEGSSSSVMIYEIDPFGDCEGFSLFNYGTNTVDLKGHTVTDGEGTISFTGHFYIRPDTRLTFVKDTGGWFSDRTDTLIIGVEGVEKKGSFILSNTGDDLYLYRGETLIDAVCYGNKQAAEGWDGDPVPISSNKYLLRTGSIDTDTSQDWILTRPGYTNHGFDQTLFFNAGVYPFSFPESYGQPILSEISTAKEEVLISMYLLTSTQLVSVLHEKLKEGVAVRILLEGYVLGQDITTELTLMKHLVDAGGEVYLINDQMAGNAERFSYFHNKYAIVDKQRIIITSENWTESNLSSNCANRGWGAVIDSVELALYMMDIFENDIDASFGDVWALTDYYPDLKPYSGALPVPDLDDYDPVFFDARVMPVLSPDNSYDALRHFMNISEERIYSQQMDVGSSYQNLMISSPLQWMTEAAKRGIDSRLILDSSIYGDTNAELVHMINNMSEIKAIAKNGGDGYSMIHNKGLIMDDIVWIGSVNWTENSFLNNREFSVVVDSPDIADFFLGLFEKDWGVNEHTVSEEGFDIELELIEVSGKIAYVFTATGPTDSEYLWNVADNDEWRSSGTNRIVCMDLSPGDHTIHAVLKGTSITASYGYSVTALEDNNGTDLRIPISAFLMIVGILLIIRRRRNNNPSNTIRYDDRKADGHLRRGGGL